MSRVLDVADGALAFYVKALPHIPSEGNFPNPNPLSKHLPTVAGVAHRFHNTCGKNVTLEEDGTRAVRVAGYAHGLVFSTKELKAEEVFEVGLWRSGVGLPGHQTGPANGLILSHR